MREGVRLRTKLYVMCDKCDMYAMLCVLLLSSWVRRG